MPKTKTKVKKSPISKTVLIVIALVIAAIAALAVFFIISSNSASSANSPRPGTITFSESGLPSGATWSIAYGGGTISADNSSFKVGSSGPNIQASVYNVSVNGTLYIASVSVQSSTVSVVFTKAKASQEITTQFFESGLPTGANWRISYGGVISSSNTDNASITSLAGTFSFQISNVTVNGVIFVPGTPSGSLKAGSSETINFENTTPTNLKTTSFSDSGLPRGYEWAVNYNGNVIYASSQNNISFANLAGAYSYNVKTLYNSSGGCTTEYAPSPNSGSLTAGSSKKISYTSSVSCNTSFTETGILGTHYWSVDYNGTIKSANGSQTIGFLLNNAATHHYAVYSQSNMTGDCTTSYSGSPASGNLASGSSQSITFNSSTYCGPASYMAVNTTFTEVGILGSHMWSVTYNGTYKSVDAPASIKFSLVSSSTFSFSAASSSNTTGNCTTSYSANPASGILKSGSAQTITFTYSTYCSSTNFTVTTFTEAGILGTHAWSVTYNGTSKSANAPSSIRFSWASSSTFSFSASSASNTTSNCNTSYSANPSSGSLKSGSEQTITFTPSTHCSGGGSPVTTTFTETGLPANINWSVDYNSVNQSAPAPYSIVSNISLAGQASSIAVTPNGKEAYVDEFYYGGIQLVNLSSNTVITTINMPWNSPSIALTPDGQYLYVANEDNCSVSVIQTSTNRIIDNISIGNLGGGSLTQCYDGSLINQNLGPIALAMAPNGEEVYLAYGVGGGQESYSDIAGINTATNSISMVSQYPFGIAFTEGFDCVVSSLVISSNEQYAYASCGPENPFDQLLIINLTSSGTDSAASRRGAFALALTPNNQELYVVNTNEPISYIIRVVNTTLPYKIISNITLESAGNQQSAAIVLSANGEVAYSVAYEYGALTIINTTSSRFIQNISMPGYALSLGLASNGEYLTIGRAHSLAKVITTSTPITFSGTSGNTYSYSVTTTSNSSGDCTTTYTPSSASGDLATGSSLALTFTGHTSC